MCRADWLVGAAFALERSGLRRKRAARMSQRLPDNFLRLVELFRIACVSWRSLFCSSERRGAPELARNFFRAKRIDAELNIFFASAGFFAYRSYNRRSRRLFLLPSAELIWSIGQ